MYLKELDLQGFKSFPEKVKLEFNKGITAVVGPNGSGKSNISDAVRWVLGEQRPKSLRGGKMEDVIFAGTANRKQVGFAEVSMVVDNSDKKIPMDYSEIKITRRVYRSGESGYFINGTECRLKDIYELFMDTGIGRDGYSIIGQGKIDEILSNKSEDRRQLFEEAAGIVKYKNRKNEAEGKLEKEQQNLVRITDIISEIENKVDPLEKQAEKAKKYLELYGEMKDADIQLFRINGEKLEKSIEEIKLNEENAAENLRENEEKLEGLKAETDRIRKYEISLSEETERINRDIAFLSGETEKNEGICNLTDEQIKNLEETLKSLYERKKSGELKESEYVFNISEGKRTVAELELNIENTRALLKEKEEALDAVYEKQSEQEKTIENYKSEMIENIKRTADIKSRIERTAAEAKQYDERQKQLENEIRAAENKMKDKRIMAKSAELMAEQNEDVIEDIKRDIERLENKKNGILKVIAVIDEGLQDKSRKLSEKTSRHKVLSDMEKEFDGYYKSVKAILNLKGRPEFKGVNGVVAQLFETDDKYSVAIETALGGSLQSIVVDNESDAKNAVRYLKTNNLGRATFLPVATVKGKTLGADKDKLLSEKGIIGAACDLVKYDKIYRDIAENLLGRTIVADTMDNAIAFARKYKQSYRIVTLDGEIFMPGGAITGGSSAGKKSGVFGRKHETERLEGEIASLKLACEGLAVEKEKNAAKINDINDEIEDKKQEAREADIELITANKELERLKGEEREYADKLAGLENEKNGISEKISGSVKEKNIAAQELAAAESAIVATQNLLNEYKENSESDKGEKDSLAEEITAIKIEISSVSEKCRAQKDNLDRLENERAALLEELISIDSETERNIRTTEEKRSFLAEARQRSEEGRKEREAKEKELLAITEKRKNETARLAEVEETANECREVILNYKNELVRLETKAEKLSEERKRLNDDMWENYEITYPEALKVPVSDESVSDITKKARILKSEIKSLGAVNVNAIEEYKETKERYEFLSKQKNDIINAEEKLKGIIKDLSGLMERQFREKLELISENFNIVFSEMFGGGQAYLKLSDESDVLGSGIEIVARPPGKNLQSMSLLSGGERALTAIAILFSILKMKPSPFCILDEIEAALDDANVCRFGDYLQRFSDDTQFIVITHRKGTMEAADVLYGVTMQEQGVSKIVSVKFDEVGQ